MSADDEDENVMKLVFTMKFQLKSSDSAAVIEFDLANTEASWLDAIRYKMCRHFKVVALVCRINATKKML